MSTYADLACKSCKVSLWLGKAVFRPDGGVAYYWRASAGESNSGSRILNRALWKFLADHARHEIKVIVEGDEDYDALDEYAKIGGDALLRGDIPFEDYLEGWPG